MTPRPIRAVIFDMDGTITEPQLNFRKIREAIGIGEPLLENMLALPPGPARDRAFAILGGFEEEAAESSLLDRDARAVLEFLDRRGVPCGLLTRNSRRSTERVLSKHSLAFRVVITREDAPAKPRPEPLWMICSKLGVEPAETLMVGDFKYDILAGRNAGTRTALLRREAVIGHAEEVSPDHHLERLSDLMGLF